MEERLVSAFFDELAKIAKDMPSFLKQDRPAGVKKIYRAMTRRPKEFKALKERYGGEEEAKELAARVAARQGKPGKQKQGPPYEEPPVGK